MDGALVEARAQSLCAQLKSDESVECWAAYHLIGDALRNDCLAQQGFARRFAERLAAEPTVLSPGYKVLGEGRSGTGWQAAIRSRPWYYGMAAAASAAAVALVGWFGVQEFTVGPGVGEFAAARRFVPVLATAADATAQASRKSQSAGARSTRPRRARPRPACCRARVRGRRREKRGQSCAHGVRRSCSPGLDHPHRHGEIGGAVVTHHLSIAFLVEIGRASCRERV